MRVDSTSPDTDPKRVLGFRDLVLFNIAAVIGVRWLAAAAHVGPGAIPLWILAAVLFFVPSAFAVSALSRRNAEEGGLYVWTREAWGDWHGFMCGWCYWLSNLFYFPQLILIGLSAGLYALGPQGRVLMENRGFMLAASLISLWMVLASHIFGLKTGRWTGNLGGLGTYAVGIVVIVVGGISLLRHGPASPLVLLPTWSWDRLNFWSQIAFAFGGLELAAVMGGEIRDPRKNVPRAAWTSGAAIAAFYVLGTLAVLALMKPADVDPVNGLAQVGGVAEAALGLRGLGLILGGLIAISALGQLGSWIGGVARLPSVMGVDRYLPEAFARKHPRFGTPYVALLFQGVACSVFLVATQIGESLRGGYQLLVDMSAISYFIPFIYLFAAAWKLTKLRSAIAGLAVTFLAIAFSLIPPGDTASPWAYEAKLVLGTLGLVLAGWYRFSLTKPLLRVSRSCGYKSKPLVTNI